MWSDALEARWHQLAEVVYTGMKEWRLQHPRATLGEIEAALDERLGQARARMLEDVAHTSPATDLTAVPVAERPPCPRCGTPLEPRGQQTRHLLTHQEQNLAVRRSYAVCPVCGTGLFPPG